MRVFFDTSVLVAALFEGHAFHRQAFPWLKRAREREFSFLVATHTLAELYSALTSLPESAADRLLTFNVKDFRRVWPSGTSVLFVPE